jgi:hypothetical protein
MISVQKLFIFRFSMWSCVDILSSTYLILNLIFPSSSQSNLCDLVSYNVLGSIESYKKCFEFRFRGHFIC